MISPMSTWCLMPERYHVLYNRAKLLSASMSDDEITTVHQALIGTDLVDMQHVKHVMETLEEPEGDWVLVECEPEK